MESKSVLSKKEAIIEVAKLTTAADVLLGQAVKLANEHGLAYSYYPSEGYDGEELDEDTAETLNRWTTSSYGC